MKRTNLYESKKQSEARQNMKVNPKLTSEI